MESSQSRDWTHIPYVGRWILKHWPPGKSNSIIMFINVNHPCSCCSVSHVRLCDPMDCSMPGFPLLHYLPEFAQTHVHWVSDGIQPSHPLLPPSPLALNLSQHQSFPMSWFFASGGQSIGASASASVLPMNIQGWFPLRLTGLISLLSKGLSRVFSNTTVQKHQFFSAQLTSWQIEGGKVETVTDFIFLCSKITIDSDYSH